MMMKCHSTRSLYGITWETQFEHLPNQNESITSHSDDANNNTDTSDNAGEKGLFLPTWTFGLIVDQNLSNRGDTIVLEVSDRENDEYGVENESPMGGK